MFTLFQKKEEEVAGQEPAQRTTMLVETKLSHVPHGCHAVHGNQKPSKAWYVFEPPRNAFACVTGELPQQVWHWDVI